MHLFLIIILIFKYLRLLHVSKQRVHLQEDGCIYRYGIGYFSFIRINSVVGNRLPEDEPPGSKHVEDNKRLKIKILIWKRCIFSVYII